MGLSKRFEDSSPASFQGPSLTNVDVSKKPLRALKLITRLSTTTVATKSYELFGTIMQSGVAEEKKMEAARLALHAAYRSELESVPPVGDPKHILDFLRFHIGPCVELEERSHAVSLAMRAIDSASNGPKPLARTWHIEAANELLTGFHESPHLKEFGWWYGILWFHYGGLGLDVRKRVDEIARNGDDRVDLKQCRTAIEKELERVKEWVKELGRVNELEKVKELERVEELEKVEELERVKELEKIKELELERVKELERVTNMIVTLEEAYTTLSTFIDHREKVREEFSGVWTVFISLFPPDVSTNFVYPMAD